MDTKESKNKNLTVSSDFCKGGHITKEEMKKYIKEKLENADYTETEIIYGFLLGLSSK